MTKRRRIAQAFRQLLSLRAAGARVSVEPWQTKETVPAHNGSLTAPRALHHNVLAEREAAHEVRDNFGAHRVSI